MGNFQNLLKTVNISLVNQLKREREHILTEIKSKILIGNQLTWGDLSSAYLNQCSISVTLETALPWIHGLHTRGAASWRPPPSCLHPFKLQRLYPNSAVMNRRGVLAKSLHPLAVPNTAIYSLLITTSSSYPYSEPVLLHQKENRT